jgi:hypothetical protein
VKRVVLVLGMLAVLGRAAAAQGATHVLIVTGLSGDPQFATEFGRAARAIYDTARSQWHVADSSLIYLAEDPAADPTRIREKSTKDALTRAFDVLGRRAAPGDLVLVFLLGHGSGEMEDAAVNLPGPDPVARDYAAWLHQLDRATVVFINASSGSGDFLPVLSGPNRVIITATRTSLERNESVFGTYMARGLTDVAADANKDGHISVLEAFLFAQQEVTKVYTSTNRMQTEHGQLDDDGDRKGTPTPGTTGVGDGMLAARIAFGGKSASTDPRVTALVAEQRVLEAQVDSLKRRKATTDSTAYQTELERLLILIAQKTQAINAITGVKQP